MANNLRFQVVAEAFKKHPVDVKTPTERPSEYFGKYVFDRRKMRQYLPANVFDAMVEVMDHGARLDRSIADAVAAGMKQWATENGVTHYTHWFQPLTEGTAEKHDAFVEWDDGKAASEREQNGARSDSAEAQPALAEGKRQGRAYLSKSTLKELRMNFKIDIKLHPKQHRK